MFAWITPILALFFTGPVIDILTAFLDGINAILAGFGA